MRIENDAIRIREFRQTHVISTRGRGRRDERDVASMRSFRLELPINWAQPDMRREGNAVLDDHPGRWECQWKINGEVVRTIAFTVHADGSITPHAEEAAGILALDAHLVDTTIPNSDRVDPAGARALGIAYGHQLQIEAGRRMLDALPTLGTATLPQPASAGRGRRRSRRR